MDWRDDTRVRGCLVHIEILEGKVWIHPDRIEDGIVIELVEAGIPQSDIVLAFHHPDVRKPTEFTVQ